MYSSSEFEIIRKQNWQRFTLFRKISYTIGVWPKCPYSGCLKRIIFGVIMFSHFWSMYGQIAFFIHNIRQLYMITEGCCSLLTLILTAFKLCKLYNSTERMEKILQEMTNHGLFNNMKFLKYDISFTDNLRIELNDIMRNCWKESTIFTKIFISLATPVPFLYSAVPLVANFYNTWWHRTPNVTMKFPYKTYYPNMEDVKDYSPWYQIIFLLESGSGYSTLSGLFIFDGLFVYFVLYATGMIKCLNRMILYSTSDYVPRGERVDFMKECIQHHTRILKFCNEINELYSTINILQLLISMLIICVIAFHASNSENSNTASTILMIIYLLAGIYQLGLYCIYGQKIINESSIISTICYSCNWYDNSKEFKHLIEIMILRSQRPIEMSAWKISVMSLETFSAILRSAASYYTALQTLVES